LELALRQGGSLYKRKPPQAAGGGLFGVERQRREREANHPEDGVNSGQRSAMIRAAFRPSPDDSIDKDQ
jgi:hypothetical protein